MDDAAVKAKRRELAACSERIRKRKTAQDEDFARRQQLFRDLIGLGEKKSEIAKIAGVSHAMVNDALSKDYSAL